MIRLVRVFRDFEKLAISGRYIRKNEGVKQQQICRRETDSDDSSTSSTVVHIDLFFFGLLGPSVFYKYSGYVGWGFMHCAAVGRVSGLVNVYHWVM